MRFIDEKNRSPSLTDFRDFGSLLAYCFLFGIIDVHKENLLISENGLQVVDVEQAFADLLLPSQTLLVAVHDLQRESAGLRLLGFDRLEELALEPARALIEGFLDCSQLIWDRADDIAKIFELHRSLIEVTPSRVFFRRTRDYVDRMVGRITLLDEFPAETTQMSRKDVPYFFSYVGRSSEIFSYVSEDWQSHHTIFPSSLIKFVDYCNKEPALLLKPVCLAAKIARGSLYLMKKLAQLGDTEIHRQQINLKPRADYYHFSGLGVEVRTKRTK